MTTSAVIKWIIDNLGSHIDVAISQFEKSYPKYAGMFTKDLMAGMAYREVGVLLHRYIPAGVKVQDMHAKMKGDYGRREGETKDQYHGFSYWQLDVNTWRAFIDSNGWVDPVKSCYCALTTLKQKLEAIDDAVKASAGKYDLLRSTIAAYNCGEGNVLKVIRDKKDIDARTHEKNYSKMVLQYRSTARGLLLAGQ